MQVLSPLLVLGELSDPSTKLRLTGIPWEIITKITTPLMLVALCAVLYYGWKLQRIRAYTEQLKVLPSKDRGKLAGRLAEHYGVPVSGLAPADRVAIVIRELETKHSERRHNTSLAFGAFALASILWFISTVVINRPAPQPHDDQVWVQGNVYDADGTPIERDASVSVPGQPGSFLTTENGLFSFRISRAAILAGDSVEIYVRAYGKTLVDTGKVGNYSNRLKFPTRVRPSEPLLLDTGGVRPSSQKTDNEEAAAILAQEADKLWKQGQCSWPTKGTCQYEPALKRFTRASQLMPLHAEYQAQVGATLTRMLRFSAAAARFRRAIELDPNVAWYYDELCVTLRVWGQEASAAESCRRAIELDPSYREYQPEFERDLRAAYEASLNSGGADIN
jgi:hypothetical protein